MIQECIFCPLANNSEIYKNPFLNWFLLLVTICIKAQTSKNNYQVKHYFDINLKVQMTLIYDVVRIKFECYCVKCQAYIGLVLGHGSNKQIYTVVLLVTCTHTMLLFFYKILRSIHYNFTEFTCSYL